MDIAQELMKNYVQGGEAVSDALVDSFKRIKESGVDKLKIDDVINHIESTKKLRLGD